jgi:hypothetical protein
MTPRLIRRARALAGPPGAASSFARQLNRPVRVRCKRAIGFRPPLLSRERSRQRPCIETAPLPLKQPSRGADHAAAPDAIQQSRQPLSHLSSSSRGANGVTAGLTNQGPSRGRPGRGSGFCSGPGASDSSSRDHVAAKATLQKRRAVAAALPQLVRSGRGWTRPRDARSSRTKRKRGALPPETAECSSALEAEAASEAAGGVDARSRRAALGWRAEWRAGAENAHNASFSGRQTALVRQARLPASKST